MEEEEGRPVAGKSSPPEDDVSSDPLQPLPSLTVDTAAAASASASASVSAASAVGGGGGASGTAGIDRTLLAALTGAPQTPAQQSTASSSPQLDDAPPQETAAPETHSGNAPRSQRMRDPRGRRRPIRANTVPAPSSSSTNLSSSSPSTSSSKLAMDATAIDLSAVEDRSNSVGKTVTLGKHRRERNKKGPLSGVNADDTPDMIAPPGSPFRSRTITSSATMTRLAQFFGAPGSPVAGMAHGKYSSHPFQTIEYEEMDGPVLRQHHSEQTLSKRVLSELSHYLFVLLVTVVITLLFIFLFWSSEKLGEKRIEWYAHLAEDGHHEAAVGVAIFTSLIAALIPSAFIIAFSPNAVGSGMTDILSFLNGSHAFNSQNWVEIFARCLGAVGIVVSGLFSGLDGPFARIGAGIALLFSRKMRSWSWSRSIFYGETEETAKSSDRATRIGWKAVLSVLEQRRFRIHATLGASVAIAAIFRAPLGGVMFALEEAISIFEPSLVIRTAFATIVAYIMVGFRLPTQDSDQGIFPTAVSTTSLAQFPTHINCEGRVNILEFVFYIFIGLIAAVIGTMWNYVLGKVQRLRMKYVMTKAYTTDLQQRSTHQPTASEKFRAACFRILEVAAVCVITSIIVVLLPLAPNVDECRPLSQATSHVLKLVPSVCDDALNVTQSQVRECLSAFTDEVCLPLDVKTVFDANVVVFYENRLAEQLGKPIDRTQDGIYFNVTSDSNLTDLVPTILDSNSEILHYLKYSEEEECFYPLRSLLWSTPDKVLRQILLRGVYSIFSAKSLGIFFLCYLVLSVLTYYIALPTDLLIPNLVLGSVAGRMLGLMANFFKESAGLLIVDPGLYALLGLAALWSGTSRLVITVAVISLELTGDFDTLPALLIVTFTAAWTSSLLDDLGLGESLYHTELEMNGTPFLPHEPPHKLRTLTVFQVMGRPKLSVLSATTATVADGFKTLDGPHNGFPVVEIIADPSDPTKERYRPVGFIHRDRLEEVLLNLRSDGATDESRLDLSAAFNSSPTIVSEEASASKVFKSMRMLGLRQVLVTDREGFLVSILTRKDLLNASMNEKEKHRVKQRRKELGLDDTASSSSGDKDNDPEIFPKSHETFFKHSITIL